MVEIKIPKYLNEKHITYNFITQSLYMVDTFLNEEDIISLDFKELEFIEGNLCAVLAAYIDLLSIKGKVEFKNISYKIKRFFLENGFAKKIFNADNEIHGKNSIDFKEFERTFIDEEIGEYIYSQFLNNNGMPKMEKILQNRTKEGIFELFENARTHGKCNKIYTCGQYFPMRKKILFSVTNVGYTIPRNVMTKMPNFSHEECIEWAMQLGNSTKQNIPGGAGLSFLEAFIKNLNGKIQIISGNGLFEKEYKNNKPITTLKSIENPFPGTIVNIKFYLMSDEIVLANLNEEIEDIQYKVMMRGFFNGKEN